MQSVLPLLVALCTFAPLSAFGALYPVEQNSNPAGLVSTSAIIEGGQTYQSIDPQLNKNGYTFGYWAIDGVRQQGADGRSLTRVSSVINAESNYTAYYYGDNVDTDGDGVKDWFEYRMFGNLSSSPTDDSDGDGFSNKRESELGQDALVVDFMEAGGIAGRMSNTITYADTSMLKVTIKSNPTGFITTSITNKEMNASVATQSLNGATNGSHFAYWTINGVRQASPNGVASSKVSLNISGTTEIVAHYVPSSEDTDGDGVMDWFELYQFGDLSAGPEDDSDGDGFSNKREDELGQEATIAEFTEAGGIAGRMSNTITYADTSMIQVTIKSNPTGFITTSVTNKEVNATVTTQSLNGATNGSHFAYWTINGVRQASPNGVASSKVSAVVTADTEFVAHYVPSSEDTDGDGVMDWFEKYQFGNLDLGPNDDPDGDGFTNKREGELGQEATIAEFTEIGGIAGRMSNSLTYYVQQNRPPSNLELNNTIVFLNKEANRTVGSFTPTDPDDPGRLRAYTYRLLNQSGGEDNQKYNLLGNQLRASQTFTVEGNHSILVRVTDDENASFDKNFTIRAINPLRDDDGDGLGFEAELIAGTNPNNPDTDGDGASDGSEVSANKDPLDPNTYPNRPPRDLNATAVLAFSENQPVGKLIGEFNATDPDGHAITYHFVSGENNNSFFTLDTNGTLKTATTFDYESNASSYTITVQAKDEFNATTEGNFTVTLLDLNELPNDLNSTSALTILENQPVGTIIGEFNATDPDGHAITYSLEHQFPSNLNPSLWLDASDLTEAGATWADRSNAGNDATRLGAPVLAEHQPSGLKVMRYSGSGQYHKFDEINDIRTVFWVLSEDSDATSFGFLLGTTDPNAGGKWHDDGNGNFFSSSYGDPMVYNGATRLNGVDINGKNTQKPHQLSIVSHVTTGNVNATNFSKDRGWDRFWKGNLGELIILNKELSAAEIASVEQYLGAKWKISVTGAVHSNDGLFSLDQNGTLKTATTFDYESNASSYIITVLAKDELNGITEGNFTITLQNVVEDLDQDGTEDHFDDDIDGDGFTNAQELAYGSDPFNKNSVANTAPTDLNTSSNLSILENLPPGEWVAEFNATDSDFNSTLKYSLVVGDGSSGNSFFTIDENGTLRTSKELNYEAKSNHSIRVRVSDEHNASVEKSFIITVEDMDEGVAPSLGDGSEQNPYQIDTLAHLKWLSFSHSIHDGKHFIQTSDINASETKSWSNGYGFRPIGNIHGYFRAQYNGNRHKIFGLFVNRPQQQRSAGFISILGNSTLKDISIVDGNVTGFDGVGGLVGTLESNSSLKYSSFEGSVAGRKRVGGLVGRAAISFIENSFSVGKVSSLYNEAGGIVGANGGNSTISDSYSHAEVSGGGIFGGVAGFNVHGASIKRSFSTGNVPKFSSSGGLVGNFYKSTISSSFWDINASGQSTSAGEGAVGKSTVEMMNPNTFTDAGWDFNLTGGTWKMIAGQTYPHLAWEDLPNTLPFDLNATAPLQVSENQPSGAVVGQLTAKDLDVPSLLTFSLVEGVSDNDFFSLDANGTLRTGKRLDYESNATLRIRVKVSDQHNASIAQTFIISVLNVVEDFDKDGIEDHYDPDDDNDGFSDVDELEYGSDPLDNSSVINKAPEGLKMEGGEILENQPVGTQVARFIGIDADVDDNLTYRMVTPAQNKEFPFGLSPSGVLRSLKSFDYEVDEHNYSIRVRVSDDRNTSFEKSFTLYLRNQIEDLDGDKIEDFYDEDIDGDGFNNDTELAEGTDPRDPYSSPMLPILKTISGYLDENGSIILRGRVNATGDAKISDFGFVLSPSLSLRRNNAEDIWIRGEGRPTQFTLKVEKSPFEGDLYFRAWAKNVAGYGVGPVKKVIFSEEPPLWWGTTEELAVGWKNSSWLGAFRAYEGGWIYHARLGWLYSSEAPKQSVWLWREKDGWLWTKSELWPYLWSKDTADWLYLLPGKAGEPSKFYDFTIEAYR